MWNGQWVLLLQAAHLLSVPLSSEVRLLCFEEEFFCPLSPWMRVPVTTSHPSFQHWDRDGISVSRSLTQRGLS